jgi:hypothetical protein
MAAHAMTMVHTSELQRTAPLAYAPVFYVDQCVKAALPAGMDDSLLAAIEGTRKVFAKISDDTDTRTAEERALDILFTIAVAGYARQSIVLCFAALEMMLRAAQHDIRIRGYRDVTATLRASALKLRRLAGRRSTRLAAKVRRPQVQNPITSAYGFADCVVKLEILARAAEASDNPQLASAFREHGGRPENIPEADWQEFTGAVGTRTVGFLAMATLFPSPAEPLPT